jgi:predicted metalloendopeptidase
MGTRGTKLMFQVNKTDWVRHGQPAVVNAFYSPLENSIQFPAGILQVHNRKIREEKENCRLCRMLPKA